MTDLELAVRTIESMLPDISTKQLQKWQGILTTALLKVEAELKATFIHTCAICFEKEYGYRDELPSAWYKKGESHICFRHEYADSERLLKEAGQEVDAFFPPEVTGSSVESLKVMADNMPPPPSESEKTLDELMDLI